MAIVPKHTDYGRISRAFAPLRAIFFSQGRKGAVMKRLIVALPYLF